MDLLVMDDFGLQAFDNHAREALMDITDDRYNEKSTIVSSQIPVSAWYDLFGGEGTQADAFLDRLVNYLPQNKPERGVYEKGYFKK